MRVVCGFKSTRGKRILFLTKANFSSSKKKSYLLDELRGAHNNLQTLLASLCNLLFIYQRYYD